MAKIEIVIDKSYLDAVSQQEFRHLCDTHVALMLDVLFYELLTTREDSRKRCFSKFPDGENPVMLIPNVGAILRYEQQNMTPSTLLSQHRICEGYTFNTMLREGTFTLEGEVLDAVEALRGEVESDTKNFIERCMIVHQFFPELNGIDLKKLPDAISAARDKVASNADFVLEVYESFLVNPALSNAPESALLNEHWAYFRWVQCQILAALRVFARHQGQLPSNTGNKFWESAEHSMHDVYYVMLAALADGLASCDKAVVEDYQLVKPGGLLFSPIKH